MRSSGKGAALIKSRLKHVTPVAAVLLRRQNSAGTQRAKCTRNNRDVEMSFSRYAVHHSGMMSVLMRVVADTELGWCKGGCELCLVFQICLNNYGESIFELPSPEAYLPQVLELL